MAYEHVIAFFNAAQRDRALHDRIEALDKVEKTQRPAEMVKMGEAKGFSFTTGELSEMHSVAAFLRTVRSDAALQTRVQSTEQRGRQAADDVVKIARESGFSFSTEALAAATKMPGDGTLLDDAELGSVVGGLLRQTSWMPYDPPFEF